MTDAVGERKAWSESLAEAAGEAKAVTEALAEAAGEAEADGRNEAPLLRRFGVPDGLEPRLRNFRNGLNEKSSSSREISI